MIVDSDRAKGWMVSIAVHLLLLVIFFLWRSTAPVMEIPREVEVAFLSPVIPIGKEAEIAAPAPVARRSNPAPATPRIAPVPPVNHGARRTAPAPERSDAASTGRATVPGDMPPPVTKDQPALHGDTGASSSTTGAGSKTRPGSGSAAPSAGPVAGAGGSGVTPLIDWTGGVTRQRIAGGMPGFPEGQHREMQIVARFTVAPDGRISDIEILRKGDPRYEDRVLAAMRGWRFNRLPAGVEQADQSGKATFLFKLK